MITSKARAKVFPTLILLLLAAVVILSPVSRLGEPGEEATFCLGFILLFAFYLARILEGFALPQISSYIFAGVLSGPFVLNILSRRVVGDLQLFDDLALAIIALIAGGEMRIAVVRARARAFTTVISAQVLFSFLFAMALVFLARPMLPFMTGAAVGEVMAVGLIFGLITAARSPATTIGVVTETRSRGPVTELVVGITVILDVLILVLTALVLPLASVLVGAGEAFNVAFARDLALEIFGSAAIGILFGAMVGSYIRWVGEYLPLFLVGMGFMGSVISRRFGLEPLLSFMVAGFVVENFTALGDSLIKGLERSAFPVYVVFFAISGASINLDALRSMWLLAGLFVVVRAFVFYAGGVAAARFSAEVAPHARSLWMGFLPQAGVTIGIAALVERRFHWGGEVETIVLAVVAVNQLLGPIALKALLQRKGETGKMESS